MARPDFHIHGFAIISDDDCIADRHGTVPVELRNDADWAYFQMWLDRAALTVLGRLGHEANPNTKGRARLILSRSVNGLEQRSDGLWWNPQVIGVADALRAGAPDGGLIAVPGGKQVFDLFLAHGYDVFHLTRAHGVTLPGGVALFSDGGAGFSAEHILSRAGLKPAPKRMIDEENRISLVVFAKSGRHADG